MDSWNIVEEIFLDADKPLRRTAFVDDRLLLTAQGDEDGTDWVLGWPVAQGTEWQGVLLASASLRPANKMHHKFAAVFGDSFLNIANGNPLPPHQALKEFEQLLHQHDGQWPALFVFDAPEYELETIFDPHTTSTVVVTSKMKNSDPSIMEPLIRRFHAEAVLVDDSSGQVTRDLMAEICRKTESRRSSGEQAISVGRRNLPSR